MSVEKITKLSVLKDLLKKREVDFIFFVGSYVCPGCKKSLYSFENFSGKNISIPMFIIYVEDISEIINIWDLEVVPTIFWLKNNQIIEKSEGFVLKNIQKWVEKIKF
jgi:hypothetical protein